VKLLERETPESILPLLWPPNLPDLNPVYYSVGNILQQKVYKTRMTDLDELKHHIRTEWLSWITPSLQLLCISDVVVSLGASRPAAVISSTVFDFDNVFAAITATFLAVIYQSNSCTPICRFGLTAVVSYDFVLCNT